MPGSCPPFPYHSLVADPGTGHASRRYREVMVFHGDAVLIEYIIAYRRAAYGNDTGHN